MLLYTIILISIVSIVLLILKSKKKNGNKIRHVYSIFAPLYYLYRLRKDGIRFTEEIVSKYGTLFKYVTPYISMYFTAEPVTAQKVLSSSDHKLLRKPFFANFLFTVSKIDNGLVALDDINVWSTRRKFLNHTVSYKSLCGYVATYCKFAKLMEENLLSENDSKSGLVEGETLDEILTLCNIKTISSIVMGAELASDEENRKFREDFQYTKNMTTYRCYHPWLVNDFIWSFHPESKKFKRCQDGMLQFISKLTQIYKMEMNGSTQIIDSKEDMEIGLRQCRPMILDMLEHGFTDEAICAEVLTFIIGGHESTATQTQFLMFLLALNPTEMRKCQEEIDNLLQSSEKQWNLTMEDLSSFKHLERCIFESQRILPVFPVVMRHIETPVKIDDSFTLEVGSNVLVSMWSLHRNSEIYPNPLRFDPERFTPENRRVQSLYSFIPFSAGPRNCIGWKLAIMQIKVVMIGVLKEFDILTNDKFEDVKILHDFTVHPEKPIDLRLRKRSK